MTRSGCNNITDDGRSAATDYYAIGKMVQWSIQKIHKVLTHVGCTTAVLEQG